MLANAQARLVFGQPAASASESPSIVTMLSQFCSGNSHTAQGVWIMHRPKRPRRVRSARDAFPTARLHSLQANAMPGPPDVTYGSLADTLLLAFPSGSSSSWLSGALGLAPPELVCGRAARSSSSATAKLCVVVGQLPTSVQNRCVVTRSQSGFLHQLDLLVQLLRQPIEVITTSSDDEIVNMHDFVQIS